MSVELYGAPTGNCVRAAIALEEAGIPFVCHRVDLLSGQQRSPDHLGRNPAGKVPTLVERHAEGPPFVLSQSNAIILHAAAGARDGLLLPSAGAARMQVLERFFYFVTDVIAPSHAAFFLRMKADNSGADLLDARSREALQLAERFAGETPFMGGQAFTIADIAAVTIAAHLEPRMDWTRLPNLRRWMNETRARPAVERGFRAFDQSG